MLVDCVFFRYFPDRSIRARNQDETKKKQIKEKTKICTHGVHYDACDGVETMGAT